jgi:hypothetical protein
MLSWKSLCENKGFFLLKMYFCGSCRIVSTYFDLKAVYKTVLQ